MHKFLPLLLLLVYLRSQNSIGIKPLSYWQVGSKFSLGKMCIQFALNTSWVCQTSAPYSNLGWVWMSGPEFWLPIPKLEKMQICSLCLNHLFHEGPFFNLISIFTMLIGIHQCLWQPIGKPLLHPLSSLSLLFPLGFVTFCFVIMNTSIAWIIDQRKLHNKT